MNSKKQAALIFIFVTVVLDVLSLGVVIPVLPKLIEEFVGETGAAARYNGVFASVWAAMQFVAAPIIGAMSDQLGRRRVLLVSCFGLGFDYILMALAPNLTWLFIGRIISGITAASFATAAAYIADITPPDKRASGYAVFGAAWGLGFVIGPALGGALGAYDKRWPFWLAAALTLLNASYGYFILPESLTAEKRKKFSWKRANPLGSLRLLRSHPELMGIAAIILLYQFAHQVLQSVFVLYGGYRYGWSEKWVGYTLAAVGIASIIMQGGVVRRAAGKLSEPTMLYIGLTFGAIGYLIYGLAAQQSFFWCGIPVFAFVGFFSPAVQGLMTKRVGVSEQGQLQGVNSSLMGIAGCVAPWIFSYIFDVAIHSTADKSSAVVGAPFFLAVGLHVIALVIAFNMFAWSKGHAAAHVPAAQHEQT
ncbi:MAG: TCR/Tet family MFS transporter [Pirellulales bacterium]